MRNLLLALPFLVSCGINTTSGTYTGVIQDVMFGGLIFDSCEIGLKSSKESSTFQHASSKDKSLCDKLQNSIGKEVVVKYKNSLNNPTIDSNFIIESVEFTNKEENNG